MKLGRELMKKVAFDIHGVIDADYEFFSWLSHLLKEKSVEVHIITGGRYSENARLLKNWNIYYDCFFSITDHHVALGTPIVPNCPDGQVCIADDLWDRAKGDYCKKHDIHLLVDDTPRYKDYMHKTHFERW